MQEQAAQMRNNLFDLGEPNVAYAKYFSGQSYCKASLHLMTWLTSISVVSVLSRHAVITGTSITMGIKYSL